MPTLPSFHLLHLAGQRADNLFADQGSPLTPRQYVVLAMLEGGEGGSQTDIVRATGIDRSTLAVLVKRLVTVGLCPTQAIKNRRARLRYSPHDTGRKVLDGSRGAATLNGRTVVCASYRKPSGAVPGTARPSRERSFQASATPVEAIRASHRCWRIRRTMHAAKTIIDHEGFGMCDGSRRAALASTTSSVCADHCDPVGQHLIPGMTQR